MKNLPKKTKKAVVFGTGGFAEVVDMYLTYDSPYEVAAFTSTDQVSEGDVFRNRPLIEFDALANDYPPDQYELFIAVGYRKLNALRLNFMNEAIQKGYNLLSYVSSQCSHWIGVEGGTLMGKNVFIFEDNTLQPFVSIADGVILWSGNHIGHHSHIEAGCFISSHVVISGNCTIGKQSFLGVNATISEGISIGVRNLIGPSTLIQKNTGDDEAYISNRTKAHKVTSSRFMR